jgi:hypothetical protein
VNDQNDAVAAFVVAYHVSRKQEVRIEASHPGAEQRSEARAGRERARNGF